MKILINSTFIVLILLSVLIAECKHDKYSDYETTANGLRYKIIKRSESKIKLETGDIVELNLKYSTENDSVLFNSDELRVPFRMEIRKSSHNGGSFENALLILSPGSKGYFIISADSFYNKTLHQKMPNQIKKGSNLLFDISIIRKVEKKEIENEQKEIDSNLQKQEEDLLKQYLAENRITVKPSESGMYYIEVKKGKGKFARNGDHLEVNYIGMLINQKVFDSSYERNESFSFELGKGQVIEGWDEGFLHMQKGGKAKLIIPSKLAYDNKGYGKLIPPFSTLIFEVELLKIK